VTTAVCANLNYARSAQAHNDDLAYLRDEGADIILGQELAPKAGLPRWDVVGAGHDERVLVSRSLYVERSGTKLSALSRFGQRIGLRVFSWAVVDCDLGSVAFVSVHMPPRRMTGTLTRVYGFRLRRLLRRFNRHGLPWIAGGDWNRLLTEDPASLARLLGARWYGPRIDGFAVSPRLAADVTCRADRSRIRHDDHPFVWLELTPHHNRKEKP
jgi:exonuclease III